MPLDAARTQNVFPPLPTTPADDEVRTPILPSSSAAPTSNWLEDFHEEERIAAARYEWARRDDAWKRRSRYEEGLRD